MRVRSLLGALVALALVAGCGPGPARIAIDHVHGLGYDPKGAELIVPAHDGLRIYGPSGWRDPGGPRHDFMGYAPTVDGFFSSGHPAPGSKLTNPLGLVFSSDLGKTLKPLGFVGESDFHLLAAGYKSKAIFLYNPAPNSRLKVGFAYSEDQGKTWKQGAARGFQGMPIQLAVHPTRLGLVAVASDAGLFVSTDAGDSFALIPETRPTAAVHFHPDGEQLLFAMRSLNSYAIGTGLVKPIGGPSIGEREAIAFVAVNPARPAEIAAGTFGADIYLSTDGGTGWKVLLKRGKTPSQ